jgi:hypothetical protein
VLLVGARRDRRVLSFALGDALTVGEPPPAGEVQQPLQRPARRRSTKSTRQKHYAAQLGQQLIGR